MRYSFALSLSILITLLGISCDKSKSPPPSKEGIVISKLQQDKTQPAHVREGAGIMLAILEEKDNISMRDYLNAKWETCSVRNLATVQAWVALLYSVENKLPESLPTAENIKQYELESNRQNVNIVRYNTVSQLGITTICISALSSLDMPEAKSEIDAYLQRFEKKYGNSSGGKKMLELYRLDRSMGEHSVSIGAAPWQVGPNPSSP